MTGDDLIPQTWDHFLADAVPTAVMGLIALSGGGAVLLSVYRVGYLRGLRRRAEVDALAEAAVRSAETVPLPRDGAR